MDEKDIENLVKEKLIEEIAEEVVKYYVNWHRNLMTYWEKADKEMLEKMREAIKKIGITYKRD